MCEAPLISMRKTFILAGLLLSISFVLCMDEIHGSYSEDKELYLGQKPN